MVREVLRLLLAPTSRLLLEEYNNTSEYYSKQGIRTRAMPPSWSLASELWSMYYIIEYGVEVDQEGVQ